MKPKNFDEVEKLSRKPIKDLIDNYDRELIINQIATLCILTGEIESESKAMEDER